MDASELKSRVEMYGHWFILSFAVTMCTTVTLVIYAAFYMQMRSSFLEANRATDVVLLLTRIGELAHDWTDEDLEGKISTMLTVREQKQMVGSMAVVMNDVFLEKPGVRKKPRLLLQQSTEQHATTLSPEERRRAATGAGPPPAADEVEI